MKMPDSLKFNKTRYIWFVLFFLILPVFLIPSFGQTEEEDDRSDYEKIIRRRVGVEPVYKPVIGFGTGFFNFHGELGDYFKNAVGNQSAFKINVSTFLDKYWYFKVNIFALYGNISGYNRDFDNTLLNNFKTNIVDFGFNVQYSFEHFIDRDSRLKPFISLGVETINFTVKGDLTDANGNEYIYFPDGTLRNQNGDLISRDFNYETDLRERNLFGEGKYAENTFGIPVDLGFHFELSKRLAISMGTSIHLLNNDLIYNISSNGSNPMADKKIDWFDFSYITLQLDMFSYPETVFYERAFFELEVEPTELDDEDYDEILDFGDLCPGTPEGVEVDFYGCALDEDDDGVPDYMDKEENTPLNAFVDNYGEQIGPEELAEMLMIKDAVNREDVAYYLFNPSVFSKYNFGGEIPEKYTKVDIDGDGYVSFDELLRTIDDFFDYKSGYKTEDIYELNNLFFNQ